MDRRHLTENRSICAIHEIIGKANPEKHTTTPVQLTLPSIQTDHNKD